MNIYLLAFLDFLFPSRLLDFRFSETLKPFFPPSLGPDMPSYKLILACINGKKAVSVLRQSAFFNTQSHPQRILGNLISLPHRHSLLLGRFDNRENYFFFVYFQCKCVKVPQNPR